MTFLPFCYKVHLMYLTLTLCNLTYVRHVRMYVYIPMENPKTKKAKMMWNPLSPEKVFVVKLLLIYFDNNDNNKSEPGTAPYALLFLEGLHVTPPVGKVVSLNCVAGKVCGERPLKFETRTVSVWYEYRRYLLAEHEVSKVYASRSSLFRFMRLT